MSKTAEDLLNVLRPLVGLREEPDGSNRTLISSWYGMHAAWCAMTMSYGLAQSGWSNDGGNTLDVPLRKTTAKGWAYVDYLAAAFQEKGLYGSEPRKGAIWHLGSAGGAHTGCVEAVNGDGTITTLEGNYRNSLARVTRRVDSLRGFCYPPYTEGDDDMTPAQEGLLKDLHKWMSEQGKPGFEKIKAIEAKVASLTAGGGSVDVDALANAVADKLSGRLAQ